MCGITGGAWNSPQRAIDQATLRRMTDVLAHRGPDGDGHFISNYQTLRPYRDSPGVALGFRRLAIIDIEGSHQPMTNEDGSIQLVFNGEIYNYPDLRRRLQGNGHEFRSAGDTEVLVHLYEDEQEGFLQHIVGMFALAIWDAPRRRLILARDRLGQKPLVYSLQRDRLLFASELKSLLQVSDVPRKIDPSAIDEYLTYQYIPHPNTIFQGIRKLPPAHYAIYEDGKLKVTRYWSPDLNAEIRRPTGEYPARLRELLGEAVRLRMRSDVPLGVFLSGGIDSSLVAALAQSCTGDRIKTFSIGFSDKDFDESHYARRVAEHLETDHHELRVEADCVDVLPKLIWHFDEPFGDSSAIPTFYLAKMTREHVTVALSGDGGDELYAGYRRYRAVHAAARIDRLPRPLRNIFAARVWQRIRSSPRQYSRLRLLKRFSEALSLPPQRRYADWVGIFNQARRAELYHEDWIASLPQSDPVDFLLSAYARCGRRDAVTAAALVDLQTYLPCDLCQKVDMASMAHSLECRQPMLDHRVVEQAMGMPRDEKLRGRRGKRVLETAFGHLVPKEVFRRRKQGFGVPLDEWFRNELKPMAFDVLLDRRSLERGYFREESVRRLLREHIEGTFNHAYRLWLLLVLELWHREWAD